MGSRRRPPPAPTPGGALLMRVTIECAPSYAMAYCKLGLGERMLVESGGMVAMSDGVALSATVAGGALKGMWRKVLGGESFFMGRYTAQVEGAWVSVAPRYPGDIAELTLDGSTDVVAEQGAFLASSDTVTMSVVAGNATSLMNREGLTMLRFTGHGTLLLCSYGGLQTFSLDEGQHLIIDTGHLVGYTAGMRTQVGPVASLSSSAASGEGLAARLTGPGMVWLQSRAEQQLRDWLHPRKAQNDS